ncbi:MAG: HU family DNA-binding protein [Ignavibacteriales bacterium]|nr:HU family DNA-binding protein [Ignavibacteriales bacterium]
MSNKIKFSELGEAIVVQSGLSKNLANNFLRKLFDYIEDSLYNDGSVRVPGIGIFRLKWKEGREGINPRTGETIDIQGHNQILFKPEAGLKRFINSDYENLKSEVIEEKVEDDQKIIEIPKIIEKPKIISEPFQETKLDFTEEIPKDKEKIITTPFEKEYPNEDLKFQKDSKLEFNNISDGKEKTTSLSSAAANTYEVNPKISEIPKYEGKINHYDEESKFSLKTLLLLLALLGVLAAIIYFAFFHNSNSSSKNNKTITLIDDKDKNINANKVDSTKVTVIKTEESHVVLRGDKLWSLSERYYKDPYLWPNIYRINSEQIKNPDLIKIGQEINVPMLEGEASDLTNTDLQNISDGYKSVYSAKKKLGKSDADDFLNASKKYERQIK